MKSGVSGVRNLRYKTRLARPGSPRCWSGTIRIKTLICILPFVRRAVRAAWAGRFMGSLQPLLRMHWDHEPTPNPSQEGNGKDADECLLPSWEGSGVGRFMESSIFSYRLSSQR